MIGTLTKSQSERVLASGLVGRIGCSDRGKVYIVPITYAFNDGVIYAHSKEGLKTSMMKKNPRVCFQVDEIDDMENWRSIIAWGKFEEISGTAAQNKAMAILMGRLHPYRISGSVRAAEMSSDVHAYKERKPVIYKITVNEITGRFEKSASS